MNPLAPPCLSLNEYHSEAARDKALRKREGGANAPPRSGFCTPFANIMGVGSLSILSSAFTVPVTDSQQDTATVSNDAYPFFFINFIPLQLPNLSQHDRGRNILVVAALLQLKIAAENPALGKFVFTADRQDEIV